MFRYCKISIDTEMKFECMGSTGSKAFTRLLASKLPAYILFVIPYIWLFGTSEVGDGFNVDYGS